MALPTFGEAENLVRGGQLLDEVARSFRDFIVAEQSTTGKTLAVRFEAIEGDEFNFKAIVHRVELLVRYEQEIDMGSMGKRLRGVIRAYLDQPLNPAPPCIVSMPFNHRGHAVSPGNAVECLTPDKEYQDNVRFQFAVLLAQHIQERITVDARAGDESKQ